MSVLVTGGSGYIGSHTSVELLADGYDVVIADNLINASERVVSRIEEIAGRSVSFHKIDVCDDDELERLFTAHPEIDSVIHFAALKAVGESVINPLEYYRNNITGALSLLRAMHRFGVRQFVFSSSATVYGDPASVPVTEDMPTSAVSPYGATKLMTERILSDVRAANDSFQYISLRYFNPIGAHPSALIGEDPNGIPNNLLPYVAQVAVGRLPAVQVFGNDYPTCDGTGVRDYIHVVDLARGHVAALHKLAQGCSELICNLGTGRGYSVLEVVAAFERACGRELPRVMKPRRPGDIAEVYADTSRAQRELAWSAQYGIDEMCADAWRWQSRNPEGYGR